MLIAFHGTKADAILAILDTGQLRPEEGAIYLSFDREDTYQFGADDSRGAAFSLEVRVSEGNARIAHVATHGVRRTIVLTTDEPLPVEIVQLWVRSSLIEDDEWLGYKEGSFPAKEIRNVLSRGKL